MQADYLIIGQGISGTLLSRSLQQEGATVIVIDNGDPASASRVASGIINPVTGKRLVRTWLAELLLPFAWDTYMAIGQETRTAIVRKCSILDMHLTREAQSIFEDKQPTESEYLHSLQDTGTCAPYFRYNYGIGEIAPALLVDVNTLLTAWRERLKANDVLIEEQFTIADLIVDTDSVIYKHITAKKIIFCDGAVCAENPYFNMLPWSKDKGEALILSIPGLPQDHIYRQGLSVVPWKDDLFCAGATHDWRFTDMEPTVAYSAKVEEHLSYWLRLPYTIVDHLVARRPVNTDRKPFIGLHPVHTSVGIFNGMGTKGCSAAPWFAHQLARYLVRQSPLMPDVDVRRFTRILSRQ